MNDAIEGAINALFKQFIVPLIVKSLIKHLATKLPFLALPFLNPILSYFLSKLVVMVLEHAQTFIKFVVIDKTVSIDVDAYNKAVDDLQKQIDLGDEAATAAAREEMKKRARNLIRFK